jgi:hypothetical protein
VVLNARGGREVLALRKAELKVVACFSEAKDSYPRVLVDTKSKSIWTWELEEEESETSVAESIAIVRAGADSDPSARTGAADEAAHFVVSWTGTDGAEEEVEGVGKEEEEGEEIET